MSGPLQVRETNSHPILFLLDPLELPRELQREDILARQRDGATLVQGFIVDEDAGTPLRGVRVSSAPGGVESSSDARGFYQLYVPVPEGASPETAAASLLVEKPGYQAQEHQHLELWSRGDWTYNLRLQRGGGHQTVDERASRRQLPPDQPSAQAPAAQPPVLDSAAPSSGTGLSGGAEPRIPGDAGNATIRVPRNIRVQDNGITIT